VKTGWAAYQSRAPRADAEAIVKRNVAQMREAGVELAFGTDDGSVGQFARHST
jgi:imidazolonepropionase-like amidohydrolase